MDMLVSTDWLSRHLHEPGLVVLDCTVSVVSDGAGGIRSASGRAEYEDGHIPSAGFADLTGDLSDASSPFEFALPTPERFCSVMGALGVGDDSHAVLYDASLSAWAARVWWMLRWVGFDRAALLDGGHLAWEAEGRPLSTEPPDRPAKRLTPALRPELIAGRDEVQRIRYDPTRLHQRRCLHGLTRGVDRRPGQPAGRRNTLSGRERAATPTRLTPARYAKTSSGGAVITTRFASRLSAVYIVMRSPPNLFEPRVILSSVPYQLT